MRVSSAPWPGTGKAGRASGAGRRWAALEGEMAIEAWHDRRAHVVIAVTVRRPQLTHAKDAWSDRVVFTLEAGEQLTSVARDLASLLGR